MMTKEEKDKAFEELLALRDKVPHLSIEDVEKMYLSECKADLQAQEDRIIRAMMMSSASVLEVPPGMDLRDFERLCSTTNPLSEGIDPGPEKLPEPNWIDAPHDVVNHPPHYKGNKFESIDIIEDFNLGFHLGNAIKYILRAGKKGNKIQDLKKAIWYLERECANVVAATADSALGTKDS